MLSSTVLDNNVQIWWKLHLYYWKINHLCLKKHLIYCQCIDWFPDIVLVFLSSDTSYTHKHQYLIFTHQNMGGKSREADYYNPWKCSNHFHWNRHVCVRSHVCVSLDLHIQYILCPLVNLMVLQSWQGKKWDHKTCDCRW